MSAGDRPFPPNFYDESYTVDSGFNESGFSEFPVLTNDLPGPNFPNAKSH